MFAVWVDTKKTSFHELHRWMCCRCKKRHYFHFIDELLKAPPPRPILQWVTKINAFSRPGVEKLRRRAVSELCWWFAPSIGLFYHLVQLPRAKFAKVRKPNVNAWSPCLTASFDLICHILVCNLSRSLQSLQICVVLAFLFIRRLFRSDVHC